MTVKPQATFLMEIIGTRAKANGENLTTVATSEEILSSTNFFRILLKLPLSQLSRGVIRYDILSSIVMAQILSETRASPSGTATS